jgi:TonB family protein
MRRWNSILLMLLVAPAMASEYQGTKRATVDVGPDGRVTDVALLDELPPAMATQMRQEIASWLFTPAEVDGHAVPSRTHVTYSLRAKALGNDAYGVEIVDVRNGPVALETPRVRYPKTAMRRGLQGTVFLRLDVAADGSVSDVTVLESTRAHSVLVAEATRSAKTMRFEPEVVNGQPVAARVVNPYTFCIVTPPATCQLPRTEQVEGVPVKSDGGAVALDSVVRLDTDPQGRLLGGS